MGLEKSSSSGGKSDDGPPQVSLIEAVIGLLLLYALACKLERPRDPGRTIPPGGVVVRTAADRSR